MTVSIILGVFFVGVRIMRAYYLGPGGAGRPGRLTHCADDANCADDAPWA